MTTGNGLVTATFSGVVANGLPGTNTWAFSHVIAASAAWLPAVCPMAI